MAYATSPSHQKRILSTKPLGKRWAKIVEDSVMKEGARLARIELRAGRQTTEDEVVFFDDHAYRKIPLFLSLQRHFSDWSDAPPSA